VADRDVWRLNLELLPGHERALKEEELWNWPLVRSKQINKGLHFKPGPASSLPKLKMSKQQEKIANYEKKILSSQS